MRRNGTYPLLPSKLSASKQTIGRFQLKAPCTSQDVNIPPVLISPGALVTRARPPALMCVVAWHLGVEALSFDCIGGDSLYLGRLGARAPADAPGSYNVMSTCVSVRFLFKKFGARQNSLTRWLGNKRRNVAVETSPLCNRKSPPIGRTSGDKRQWRLARPLC